MAKFSRMIGSSQIVIGLSVAGGFIGIGIFTGMDSAGANLFAAAGKLGSGMDAMGGKLEASAKEIGGGIRDLGNVGNGIASLGDIGAGMISVAESVKAVGDGLGEGVKRGGKGVEAIGSTVSEMAKAAKENPRHVSAFTCLAQRLFGRGRINNASPDRESTKTST